MHLRNHVNAHMLTYLQIHTDAPPYFHILAHTQQHTHVRVHTHATPVIGPGTVLYFTSLGRS